MSEHPTKDDQSWETGCPKRDDGQHCDCWYDGAACCACGDNPGDTGGEMATARETPLTSKNRTLDRFIDLMRQYGAAFAAYEHHHGAWEVDRLAQAREALIAQYRTDGAEIERLKRELEIADRRSERIGKAAARETAWAWEAERDRLRAALNELQDETQVVMHGEHGPDWADHFAPLFNLIQRSKTLVSGEPSAHDTEKRHE